MARWGRRGWRRWLGARPIRMPVRMPARRPVWGRPGMAFGRKPAWRRSSQQPARPARAGRPNGWRMAFIIFAAVCVGFFGLLVYMERNLREPLMSVASIRVKQVATESINKAISEQVAEQSNYEKLIEWKTEGSGKISGFMLNYGEHMRIASQTIQTVQRTLDEVKHVPEHIPVGMALDSAIIASFGPRVPVRFEPVGAVKVDLNTRQTDAGINMILVEVYIRIAAEVAIIIPFDTKPELVETEIPISYLLVVGDVPMYYYDNKGNPVGGSAQNAPNIALPSNPGVSTPLEEDGAAAGDGITATPGDHAPEEAPPAGGGAEGDGGSR